MFLMEYCLAAVKHINKIRKEIIENNKLDAVISMPSGVFKPYAGVSTAILIFTKTGSSDTDKVWFYDMKADGLSLDTNVRKSQTMIYRILLRDQSS